MKVYWNGELKKLVLGFVGTFLFGCLLVNLILGRYTDYARTEYNRLLASVFGNVAAAYPEVPEEEIVKVLNDNGNQGAGEEILRQYGVYKDYGAASFGVREKQFSDLKLGANIILFLLYFLAGILLYYHLRKRQNAVYQLTDYMEALNREGYRLEMEENGEDELSGLRNEIYKLTVLLKEQAERATEQKKALADTMVNISHQLKTPLTSVTVLVDNLVENPEMETETRQHFMTEITRQITGMSWLITTMLKRARLDAGVVELERKRLRIKELVEEVIQRLELATEWKNLTVSAEIPEEAEIVADAKWMAEAVMNIVRNALEHSPVGGCVEISGEQNEIYTQIVIRDHGAGITEEEQKKLFRRFYNGSSMREDSAGIGLALAKEIVEKHDGSISVDSHAGIGTAFILRFLRQ